MEIKEYSYSYAIFLHTLNSIEQHKSECGEDKMTMKQALNWWDRTPEMAKQNLRDHTFLDRETFNMIYQFYWGSKGDLSCGLYKFLITKRMSSKKSNAHLKEKQKGLMMHFKSTLIMKTIIL